MIEGRSSLNCIVRRGRRQRAFNRSNKPIATPRHSLDETGDVGIVAKRLAELIHGRVQAMLKSDEGVHRTEFGAELFTQNTLRRAVKQPTQNLLLLALRLDSSAVHA